MLTAFYELPLVYFGLDCYNQFIPFHVSGVTKAPVSSEEELGNFRIHELERGMAMSEKIRKMVISALCLTMAFLLPFLTGQIPRFGNMLLPMHIPVLLCGFLCGSFWGALTGFLTPLLRSLILSMPPMIPNALCMAMELSAYGGFAALFHALFHRRGMPGVYLSLGLAMLAGRVVWGISSYLIYSFALNRSFTLPMFFASAFLGAWPGILLQLILIPLILKALEKSHLFER